MNAGMNWQWRWWRSVWFWVGLWVLAFLVWIWVGSYKQAPQVAFPIARDMPGARYRSADWEVMLQRGTVVVVRSIDSNAPAGMTVRREMPTVSILLKGSTPAGRSWWGKRQWLRAPYVTGRDPFAGMSTVVRAWWFPFGVVVLAHVVVWVGAMWWWQRRMRRRWEESRVVEG